MNINALNSSSFRLYLFGSFIALNGLWIQRIIIGWLAWEITNSLFMLELQLSSVSHQLYLVGQYLEF